MYSVIMIFLIVVSSLAGTIFLTNAAITNWLSKQELKTSRSTQAPATVPRGGIYFITTEEYYLIH